jgi:hypothetical protein
MASDSKVVDQGTNSLTVGEINCVFEFLLVPFFDFVSENNPKTVNSINEINTNKGIAITLFFLTL